MQKIDLNPLRAGLVTLLEELERYAWSGHAVVMGSCEYAGVSIKCGKIGE
ncbi:hypothetical protein [Chlorobium phaeobacteroides]|nr:hypothetical protein [Chlorobium phaeobacteroides]